MIKGARRFLELSIGISYNIVTMTGEFNIPGYESPEEYALRISREADNYRLQAIEAVNALIDQLEAKLLLATTSNAPRNCVIETYRASKTGSYLVDSSAAWYLGGWSSPGTYTDDHYHFAVNQRGQMFSNHEGIGVRQEFRVGSERAPEGISYVVAKKGERYLGSIATIPRKRTEQSPTPSDPWLEKVLSLPGWVALEGS